MTSHSLSFRAGRCLIIAEVAQAHDGSLGLAHAFVDAIAEAGADAVKFQTHIAEAESTLTEPWRVRFSTQDANRYEYWVRTQFSEEQWKGLRDHANARGLAFLSSPFSLDAVDTLERIGVAGWKIPSGEVGSLDLVERVAASGLPILLSTGMSPLSEIDKAVSCVQSFGAVLAVLQCTSIYPTPMDKVGLNMIRGLRERYGTPVGLSDHSGTIFPALASVTLGAEVVELHVTLSREMFGPDVTSSVTTREFKKMVDGIRKIETMLSHPVDKDAAAGELTQVRALFTKGVVARIDLPSGTVLARDHLATKKAGGGIPAKRIPELVGRRLMTSLRRDDILTEDVLDRS